MDTISYDLYFKRSSGSADIGIDYSRVLFGALTYIENNNTAGDQFVINNREVLISDRSVNGLLLQQTVINGEIFELVPDSLNHIVIESGDLGGTTAWSSTTTIESIYVTPRWALA